MRSLKSLIVLLIIALPFMAHANRTKPRTTTPTVEVVSPKGKGAADVVSNRLEAGAKRSLEEFKIAIPSTIPKTEAAPLTAGGSARLNDFSQRLMAGIMTNAKPGDNVFITGPAMAGAMAMLVNGATDQAREEIMIALGYDASDLVQLNADIGTLMAIMNAKGGSIETSMSNAFFADLSLPVRPAYTSIIEQTFGAISKNVDFVDNPKGATTIINDWANVSTQGMIKQIVNEDVAKDLIAMLATAVFFKGNWETKFNTDSTYERAFYVGREEKLAMTMQGNFDLKGIVNHENGYVIAQLPYSGGEASMYVIMGARGSDPQVALAQAMAAQDLEKFSNGGQGVRNYSGENVQLPKFTLKYSNSELKSVFKAMGVNAVFEKGSLLNLSPDERLAVDYIQMDTALEVDENGTKAAGIASIGMIFATSIDVMPEPFIFDRPFAIVIRDERTGVNLFTGVINDPTKPN